MPTPTTIAGPGDRGMRPHDDRRDGTAPPPREGVTPPPDAPTDPDDNGFAPGPKPQE